MVHRNSVDRSRSFYSAIFYMVLVGSYTSLVIEIYLLSVVFHLHDVFNGYSYND